MFIYKNEPYPWTLTKILKEQNPGSSCEEEEEEEKYAMHKPSSIMHRWSRNQVKPGRIS